MITIVGVYILRAFVALQAYADNDVHILTSLAASIENFSSSPSLPVPSSHLLWLWRMEGVFQQTSLFAVQLLLMDGLALESLEKTPTIWSEC
jgi:hypothetical protein